MTKTMYFVSETKEIFGLGRLRVYENEALKPVYAEEVIVREVVEDSFGKALLREGGIPFLIDFGFQLAEDWSNPRLTGEQKAGRAIVSGTVGVFGGGVAYVLVKGVCVLVGVSTPVGWMFLVGGVVVGVSFENPFSRFVNERAFPEKPLNLQPLP